MKLIIQITETFGHAKEVGVSGDVSTASTVNYFWVNLSTYSRLQ